MATALPLADSSAGPIKLRRAARIGDGSPTSRRGFASMDPAKRRLLASQGGKAASAKGVSHRWTTEEARIAGRKGGLVSPQKPT